MSIYYPDENYLMHGSPLHLELSHNYENLTSLLKKDWLIHNKKVFVSNEELCVQIANDTIEDFEKKIDFIIENIAPVTFILSLRNDKALLLSAVKEYIAGSTFPSENGVVDFLYYYHETIAKLSDRLKKYPFIKVELEQAKPHEWVSYFLTKVFNEEINIPESFTNSTIDKKTIHYMSGFFRSFYSTILSLPKYSDIINRKVEYAAGSIDVQEHFENEFIHEFNMFLEKSVDNFVKSKNYIPFNNLFS